MLPDRVSNPGPLTYESGALPIALRGPATNIWSNGCGRMLNMAALPKLWPKPFKIFSYIQGDFYSQICVSGSHQIMNHG